MNYSDIDFNKLYKDQKAISTFKPKSKSEWDQKAKNISKRINKSIYNSELIDKLDLTDTKTLLDVGCGIGNISLPLSDKFERVYALDFSKEMLEILKEQAESKNIKNITAIERAWEDCWDDIPSCDIVIASRSMEVADMKDALLKLDKKAKKRVYITYKVGGTFVNDHILEFIGKKIVKKPDFIYSINILYQMGIYPKIDYIKSEGRKKQYDSVQNFIKSIEWSIGELSAKQTELLKEYYDKYLKEKDGDDEEYICWAVISWDKKSQPCL